MASTRHRPLPRPASSSRNPFDSSDDETGPPKPARNDRAYQNPFDDHDSDANTSRTNINKNTIRPPPSSSKPRYQAPPQNPFDDDDKEEEEEERHHHERHGSLKDKLDQGTLFDEGSRFYGDIDMQDRKSTSKSPAVGALTRVRKIKDAGAAQAARMVEGGIHQANRLKEGSVNAFKSVEGKANPSEQERSTASSKYSKDVHDRRAVGSNGSAYTIRELPSEDVPSAVSKGDLEGERSGLFETRAPVASRRTRYDDHQFRGSEIEQRSVQELEGYALQKSEDTTKSVQNCLKVAEEIKGDATNTLLTLHQQGEQLRRAHAVAHDIDESLTTGEKLLGSLGGIFSRTWKPNKSPAIKGPVDDPKDFELRRKGHHLQHRTALGLDSKAQKDRVSHRVSDSQAQTTEEKLEVEKAKQDDALSDLSNVLDQLKDMTMDMGAEISRQNVAMDGFHDDLVVLGDRVKGANVRGRHLLKK